MTGKRYFVNCMGYLCDMELSNTLSIFECADLLNDSNNENQKLKEEINLWKSKYFDAMVSLIYEYSTNISRDIEELKKEVWRHK